MRLAFFFLFQQRAEHPRHAAHRAHMREIAAHEALDGAVGRRMRIAHRYGQRQLPVKGQALLGALHLVMQMNAHPPQKLPRLVKRVIFLLGQQLHADQVFERLDRIGIARHPPQRMQVAQAALAFLDIRLEHVARIAETHMARIALGELGFDEFQRRTGHDFLDRQNA